MLSRSRKYITGLAQRLGQIPKLELQSGPLIWLHCVSVGETEAAPATGASVAGPFAIFIVWLSQRRPVTGQQVARGVFGKRCGGHLLFPIDWSWTVRRVLNA